MTADFRVERDSMGELRCPRAALWGAQTQRAVNNFPDQRPARCRRRSCARSDSSSGRPPTPTRACACCRPSRQGDSGRRARDRRRRAPRAVSDRRVPDGLGHELEHERERGHREARVQGARQARARERPREHEPEQQRRDPVRDPRERGARARRRELLPALEHLQTTIDKKAREVAGIVKTGRTHLMDAMPVRLDQELGGWAAQISSNVFALKGPCRVSPASRRAARRSAPASTRIRSSPRSSRAALAKRTGVGFHPLDNFFEAMSSQDTAVELSGQLKTTAVSFMKIANDLRWMNSGPLAGLGGDRAAGAAAGQQHHAGEGEPGDPGSRRHGRGAGDRQRRHDHGRRPVRQLPAERDAAGRRAESAAEHRAARERGARAGGFGDRGLQGQQARLDEALERNPILVTALNPVIGYEKGAAIAKQAYKEGRAIREVAAERTDLGGKSSRASSIRSSSRRAGSRARPAAAEADGGGRIAPKMSLRFSLDSIRGGSPRRVRPSIRASAFSRTSRVRSRRRCARLERPARAASVLLALRRAQRRAHAAVHRARGASQGSCGPDQLPGRAHRVRARRRSTRRCARRTRRSACAPADVEVLGSLDELLTGTGFSITPVVGYVAGDAFVPTPDPTEVASVFEVPLEFVLDPANMTPTLPRAARHALPNLRAQPRRLPHLGRDGGDPRELQGSDFQ